MTTEEARAVLVTLIARIIYKDYEECGDEYVDRVWSEASEIPEYAVTVDEFESTARKVLDSLLAEQEALLTVLGGKLYTEDDVPDVETTIARVPVWVVPE